MKHNPKAKVGIIYREPPPPSIKIYEKRKLRKELNEIKERLTRIEECLKI